MGSLSRVAAVVGALAFAASLWVWAAGGAAVDFAWAPSLDLRLAFDVDGLAILYSLLATGSGLAVLGRRGAARRLLGSVSAEVAEHAPCEVEIV